MASADVFVDVNMNGHAVTGGSVTLGADMNANSHKITGLANGMLATDAAAFGQIPSVPVSSVFGRTGSIVAANGDYTAAQVGALAATAAAAGDLTGNYPNPTIGAGKVTAAKIASATITAGNLAFAVPTVPQAAIADLNLGVLTLLTDVITAVGTIQAKVNTLLAELRTAGVISP